MKIDLRKSLILAGMSLALIGAGCAVSGGADTTTQINLSSPEAVVDGFFTAVEKGDKEGAKAYVDTRGELYANFDEAWTRMQREKPSGHEVIGSTGGDVNIKLQFGSDSELETITAVEVDGVWYVSEP